MYSNHNIQWWLLKTSFLREKKIKVFVLSVDEQQEDVVHDYTQKSLVNEVFFDWLPTRRIDL